MMEGAMTAEETKKIANKLAMLSRRDWSDERINLFAIDLYRSFIGSLDYELVSETLSRLLEERDPDDVTLASLSDAVKTRPVWPRRTALPPPEDESGPAEKRIYFPPDNGKEHFPVAHPDEKERERMREFYARAMLPATILHRVDLGIRPSHIDKANAWRRQQIAKLEGELADMKQRGELADMSREERDIIRKAERHLDSLRHALDPQARQFRGVDGLTPIGDILRKTLAGLGAAMKLHCTLCKTELTRDEIEVYTHACVEAGRTSMPEPPRWCDRCTPPVVEEDDDGSTIPF